MANCEGGAKPVACVPICWFSSCRHLAKLGDLDIYIYTPIYTCCIYRMSRPLAGHIPGMSPGGRGECGRVSEIR
jgi:hypothetical protein